jgi:4'-phosphopantetheinyl transferase
MCGWPGIVRHGREPLPPATLACWRVDLAQPDAVVTALAGVLSDDERQRAARFVFPRDRRRFIVTRACLRVLLAEHSGDAPAALRFVYASRGKPSLAPGSTPTPLHFNVSHSEDVAVIAAACDAPLGVDVEAVRPLPDMMHIASRFFTGAETDTIAAVPPHQRALSFFLCWTRKEAFSKALGDGLSFALDRYRVACRPGDPARILAIDGSTAAAAEWSVFDLDPGPGFVSAVVTRATPRSPTLVHLDVARDVLPRV